MMRHKRIVEAARGERGAVAIFVALLCIILFVAAALAVDIGSKVVKKQALRNTLDAAVLAGASQLDGTNAGPSKALTKITSSISANDASLTGTSTTFYCVLPKASTPANTADFSWVPRVCQPGSSPYTTANYPNTTYACNSASCYVPCSAASVTAQTCIPNALALGGAEPVPFGFAGVIGKTQGSTGTVVSAACSNRCGSPVSNPTDMVIIADRTGSMSSDLSTEVAAISGLLTSVDPAQVSVGLAAVGMSGQVQITTTGTGSNKKQSQQLIAVQTSCKTDDIGKSQSVQAVQPQTGLAFDFDSAGVPSVWLPIKLSNGYRSAGSSTLTASDPLAAGLNCMSTSGTGTYLAMPLRIAARYLLGQEAGLGTAGLRSGVPKAIIFETDGNPNECASSYPNTPTICTATGKSTVTASTALTASPNGNPTPPTAPAGAAPFTASSDVADANATTACNNLYAVASAAKAAGIAVATIDYDPSGSGTASQCDLKNKVASSTDLYFKAADASKLAALYQLAFNQISGKSRLVPLP